MKTKNEMKGKKETIKKERKRGRKIKTQINKARERERETKTERSSDLRATSGCKYQVQQTGPRYSSRANIRASLPLYYAVSPTTYMYCSPEQNKTMHILV